jgi:hypothetical protein
MASIKKSSAARSTTNKDNSPDARERRRRLAWYAQQHAMKDQPMTKKKLDSIFCDIEDAVRHIEATGELELNEDGEAVFYPYGEREAFPLGRAMISLIASFTLVAGPACADGLRRFVMSLAQNGGATLNTGAALDSLAQMRAVGATLTPNEFADYIARAETAALFQAMPELLAA